MFGVKTQRIIFATRHKFSLFGHKPKLRKFHIGTTTMMNDAYIRYLKDSENFQLSLKYQNQSLGINREFNFSRQASEKVVDLLGRINSSFDKVISKSRKKKKKVTSKIEGGPSSVEDFTSVCAELVENGEMVAGESVCRDVLFNGDNVTPGKKLLLRILGTEYALVLNAPWVDKITLPSCIMAQFPVYPSKLELSFVDRSSCVFLWQKCYANPSTKNEEEPKWLDVGNEYLYVPSTDDIGCTLKLSCLPVKGDQRGPPVEVVSKTTVEAGPGICPFEQRHMFTSGRLLGDNFRVVSYNILADLYADSEAARTQLYPYCPAYALNIDYRKQLIMKELIGYNADIFCLQEVDSKVFDLDLQPVLSSFGFVGVHHEKSGKVSEGLACMFHSSKFKLVESHNKHLAQDLQTSPLFEDIWRKIKDNQSLVDRVMERNTCIQLTVIDSVLNPNERLVVGNTHLYFHPNADHIRLLQAGMAIRYLEEMVVAMQSDEKRVTVLMCGDFNSTPECGVYRLMTTRLVSDDCIDWKSTETESIKGITLTHKLPMDSACGTPDFTNFTEGFSGCLDYIFYQRNNLTVTQVIPLPSLEEVTLHTALPSVVFPSDHVAIVADLKFNNQNQLGTAKN